MDMKNFIHALADFDQAIELQPDYPECYYFRGLTKNALKMYDEAILDFQTALNKNSANKGGILNGLGYSYKMKEEHTKALSVSCVTDPVPSECCGNRAHKS